MCVLHHFRFQLVLNVLEYTTNDVCLQYVVGSLASVCSGCRFIALGGSCLAVTQKPSKYSYNAVERIRHNINGLEIVQGNQQLL